jgi:hypothetical protein
VAVDLGELRALIVRAAPDPERARPVESCDPDALLDGLIPFSSVIVLGVVVAIEDRYRLRVTRTMLERAMAGGPTLRKLAAAVDGALAETG